MRAMRGTELARKAASLAVIALVIAASCLLWRASPQALLPASRLPAVSLDQTPLRVEPAPIRAQFRTGSELTESELVRSRFRVESEPESERARSRFGVDSEWGDGMAQLVGTSRSQELRTPLTARSLPFDGAAPLVVPQRVSPPFEAGPVGRALHAAGRETGDAFRTAGRVVRSLF